MSTLFPDCGVLSTPSPARPTVAARNSHSQLLDAVAANDGPAAKLGAGTPVSFYKSDKGILSASSSPSQSPRPSPRVRHSAKTRLSGNINKGVGHGIRKPKTKPKQKKASNPAKVSVRRLKQVKPPPCMAEHRSPAALLANISPGLAAVAKKRHQLSSPGVSLLDSPEAGADVVQQRAEGSKFFTSRARAAATVQITKNVMLSASYGDITLNQRGSSVGLKKNVGGTVIDKPDKPFANADHKTSPATTIKDLSPLYSSTGSNKPKPTRFAGSPSPAKKKAMAALRAKQLNNKENKIAVTNGVRSSPRKIPLQPSNNSLQLVSPSIARATSSPDKTAAAKLLNSNISTVSPGKRKLSATKESDTGLRSSPRKVANKQSSPAKSPNKTPSKRNVEISPRKLLLSKSVTPLKENGSNAQNGFSPRKSVNFSPAKIAKRNVVLEMVHESPLKVLELTAEDLPNLSPSSSPGHLMLRDSSPASNSNSPSRSNKRTPFKSKNTPSKLALTPSRITRAIIKSTNTPPKSRETPTKSVTPTKTSRTPTKTGSPSAVRTRRTTPSKQITTPTRQTRRPVAADELTDDYNKNDEADFSNEGESSEKYFAVFNPEQRKSFEPDTDNRSEKCHRVGVRASLGDSEQRVLDAGQKKFGATQCPQCSLMFEIGDPDDEKLHTQHHNRVVTALTFKSMKSERLVSHMDSRGGRCIMINSSDPPHYWRKLCDVMAVIDEELGFSETSNITARGKQISVIFYVIQNSVAGCVLSEKIDEAYRVVPDITTHENGTKTDSFNDDINVPDSKLLCCSNEPTSVKFGISRIWVRSDYRRTGLATKLVDTFRGNVVPYHYLKLDDFAFSDPTPNGVSFAQSYTKKEDFLVYRQGA